MMSKQIYMSVIGAAAMLAAAWLLRMAEGAGWIDQEGVRRGSQVMIGVALAVYANFIPKSVASPMRSVAQARWSQSALRFAGWAFTLGGLGYAVSWAWAPIDVAHVAGTAIVALATAAALFHTAWIVQRCTRDKELTSSIAQP